MPCVLLHSIGLPVFPTGAIVVVCTEKENMISLDPGLPLGWGGITDPCFTKYSLRVYSSALHTIARCPPGCMASCTNNIVRFVSLMHWWLSFLGCGSSGGCYAGRHCSYFNAAYSFLQNGLALCGGVNMCGVSVEIVAA